MPCLTTLGVTPPLLAAGKIHWTEWVIPRRFL